MIGVVAKSTGSWYEVWFENGEQIKCRLRGRFRLQKSELTNPVAVGDEVDVDLSNPEQAVITDIKPRRNYLLRKATKASSRFHIVASNLDQAIVLATHRSPRTSTGFIDRFLVTCRLYEIEPVILFNKMDLLTEEDQDAFDYKYLTYIDAGYTVIRTSVIESELEADIVNLFKNKTSLLFGHSGVGKSTLLNKLIPSALQSTAKLSDQHDKGKHTTTFAQMFQGAGGSRIIDTPGVKEFGLEEMEAWKLGHCFKEFEALIPNCKYNTCLHKSEPNCAVIDAFCRDEISEFRYQNYLNILEDIEK
ncbi:MAG: ribosome small subunit-dependent GTPase A [Bacteroidia bacterium]|nr:ribosome small subunit-dependent GTPase A [Bacteroidia bacterium]